MDLYIAAYRRCVLAIIWQSTLAEDNAAVSASSVESSRKSRVQLMSKLRKLLLRKINVTMGSSTGSNWLPTAATESKINV